MAEVQNSPQSGELTRRFTEFVLMQAQQIALLLGQMPGPEGKPMEPNLPVAKIFVDQLDMIREKTHGNLNAEESELLTKVIAELQIAYVETGNRAATPEPKEMVAETPSEPVASSEETAPDPEKPKPEEAAEEDTGKKKYSKSYG